MWDVFLWARIPQHGASDASRIPTSTPLPSTTRSRSNTLREPKTSRVFLVFPRLHSRGASASSASEGPAAPAVPIDKAAAAATKESVPLVPAVADDSVKAVLYGPASCEPPRLPVAEPSYATLLVALGVSGRRLSEIEKEAASRRGSAETAFMVADEHFGSLSDLQRDTYMSLGIPLPSPSRSRSSATRSKTAASITDSQPSAFLANDTTAIPASSSIGDNVSRRRWSMPTAPPPPPTASPNSLNSSNNSVAFQLPPPSSTATTPLPETVPAQTYKKCFSTGSMDPNALLQYNSNAIKKPSAPLRSILRNANSRPVPPSTYRGPRIHADLGRSYTSQRCSLNIVDDDRAVSGATNPCSATMEDVLSDSPEFETQLQKTMTHVEYQPGQLIIRKHEIGKEMYFLSKGSVEVLSSDGNTRYSVITAKSFFGELGVLCDAPRTASIRALDSCQCMVLTRRNLEALLQDYPAIAVRFREAAARRVAEVNVKRASSRRVTFSSLLEEVAED
ncbi:hypothetical protein SeLEV6574_g01892 [Synchytrium endobioticum]|uniref:Cyclic nucleotide-binding domain-containing protein n=1 Tax=Synchytrium endobioticum TaxID=286115 RepID=A0A507DB32_9FUNG|nr:hypothetical protein SeLEV6574_g01892 [Synchytrium endobioticum]